MSSTVVNDPPTERNHRPGWENVADGVVWVLVTPSFSCCPLRESSERPRTRKRFMDGLLFRCDCHMTCTVTSLLVDMNSSSSVYLNRIASLTEFQPMYKSNTHDPTLLAKNKWLEYINAWEYKEGLHWRLSGFKTLFRGKNDVGSMKTSEIQLGSRRASM